MSEMQDQVAALTDCPDELRPPQREAEAGEAACDSTLDVPNGAPIPCTLTPDHEGSHENIGERRSWVKGIPTQYDRTEYERAGVEPPTSADVPVPTEAQQAIAGTQALVAKHEAEGGTVKPVGDNAERLFGEDGKRGLLEEIAEDAKAKSVEPHTPTREELDAMIRADEDARAKACREAIVVVCREYNCQLTAVPTFDPMIDGGFSVGASPVIRAL